jgi:hypothetical protein
MSPHSKFLRVFLGEIIQVIEMNAHKQIWMLHGWRVMSSHFARPWSARTCPRFRLGRHVALIQSGDMSPHSKVLVAALEELFQLQ